MRFRISSSGQICIKLNSQVDMRKKTQKRDQKRERKGERLKSDE
jgi:hypothetical protein